MPNRAAPIKKRKWEPIPLTPYGSGYLAESHAFGPPDIFKCVTYHPYSPPAPAVTGYYIDYPSLRRHRREQTPTPLQRREDHKALQFDVYTRVDGDYKPVVSLKAVKDQTVDELVDRIIIRMHKIDNNSVPEIPRMEGHSFDLEYKGASVFYKINEDNRLYGQNIALGELFRRGPGNKYKLIWKEYNSRGQECEHIIYRKELLPVIDLISESEESKTDEEMDTTTESTSSEED
ncbi:hypothetical protein TWF730_004025 [Orbilia blumenaviensis]|uniref:Uncharacterized protein n=1 Tax=Orbilia blumenaviensis TaxID=1796055 RepID=A0AAV9U3S7_9PEZI